MANHFGKSLRLLCFDELSFSFRQHDQIHRNPKKFEKLGLVLLTSMHENEEVKHVARGCTERSPPNISILRTESKEIPWLFPKAEISVVGVDLFPELPTVRGGIKL
mmetsp:Transcript_13629/g.34710  ORF Transcript_13629/g.34710 Transcript_13629/m.34710 type:complete len:106 (+) Transcript_13629:331-648(+)